MATRPDVPKWAGWFSVFWSSRHGDDDGNRLRRGAVDFRILGGGESVRRLSVRCPVSFLGPAKAWEKLDQVVVRVQGALSGQAPDSARTQSPREARSPQQQLSAACVEDAHAEIARVRGLRRCGIRAIQNPAAADVARGTRPVWEWEREGDSHAPAPAPGAKVGPGRAACG